MHLGFSFFPKSILVSKIFSGSFLVCYIFLYFEYLIYLHRVGVMEGENNFLIAGKYSPLLHWAQKWGRKRETYTPKHSFLSIYTILEIQMTEQREAKITLKGYLFIFQTTSILFIYLFVFLKILIPV